MPLILFLRLIRTGIAVTAILLTNSCLAQDSSVVRSIMQLEEQRRVASLNGDTAALAQLFEPGFYEIAVNGGFRTRRQNLNERGRGDLQFTALSFDSVEVRVFGTTAIVTGIVRRSGIYKGAPFQQQPIRYSRVYLKEQGVWRIIFGQNTTIATPGN
jgi:ketosteroid isomerase-like protein